jgi:hypothetical protein
MANAHDTLGLGLCYNYMECTRLCSVLSDLCSVKSPLALGLKSFPTLQTTWH